MVESLPPLMEFFAVSQDLILHPFESKLGSIANIVLIVWDFLSF